MDGSDSHSGPSAPDIITYVGIPLAVLGVLPILYNTLVTLLALSQIKRMLRLSRLAALTRSDVVNRVIEVELPRYAVTPFDRFQHRSEYWTLSRHPSSIPGGSWTTFNWRTNTIGSKTARVAYADELRQPQVEIGFDELVCYLLDLGAVPDQLGWRLLRSAGLWTPVGCALMKSPDGNENALTVAPQNDSDGNLSLAVEWSSPWTTRNYASLPPYWVRLPPPPEEPNTKNEDGPGAGASSTPAPLLEIADEDAAEPASDDKKSLDSPTSRRPAASSRPAAPVSCQISTDGIVAALSQDEELLQESSLNLDSLYIEHLRVRGGKSDGVWFASAVTAYGTSSQTVLWSYSIPEAVLSFAGKDTVPCGVLVVLGVVDEPATPEWATKYDDAQADLDAFSARHRASRAAMEAESRMPPDQRMHAVQARMRLESEQRMFEMRDRMRRDAQREEARLMEAMHSPLWGCRLVADHNLAWLKRRGHLAESTTLKEAVGFLLHRMVLDGQFAGTLCRMLDQWKAWAENGGMRKSDLNAVREDQVTFSQASLMLGLIKDTSNALEGTLSMDLQECLRMWKKVRLG